MTAPRQAVRRKATEDRIVEIHGGGEVELGPLLPADQGALFGLFEEVVASGDGLPHEPPLTEEMFATTWLRPVTVTIAARLRAKGRKELAGAYYLKPNFAGRAAHIANAGYLVSSAHRRRGIGRRLVEDSLLRAPALGFDAIQFNLVFSSNPARVLYEELGWRAVGRLPAAVGGEDCLIYWREVG
jgi:GNAT superfamily N-acetyltransferase